MPPLRRQPTYRTDFLATRVPLGTGAIRQAGLENNRPGCVDSRTVVEQTQPDDLPHNGSARAFHNHVTDPRIAERARSAKCVGAMFGMAAAGNASVIMPAAATQGVVVHPGACIGASPGPSLRPIVIDHFVVCSHADKHGGPHQVE